MIENNFEEHIEEKKQEYLAIKLASVVQQSVEKFAKDNNILYADVLKMYDKYCTEHERCRLLQKALTLAIKKLKKLGYAFGEEEIIEEVENVNGQSK